MKLQNRTGLPMLVEFPIGVVVLDRPDELVDVGGLADYVVVRWATDAEWRAYARDAESRPLVVGVLVEG